MVILPLRGALEDAAVTDFTRGAMVEARGTKEGDTVRRCEVSITVRIWIGKFLHRERKGYLLC